MGPIRNGTDLDALVRAASAWAVVAAWAREGLFDVLDHEQPVLVDALPGDSRALRVTAPILAHLGLLVLHASPDGDRYSLSATARELRARGLLDLRDATARVEAFGRLNEVLRVGGPLPELRTAPRPGGVATHDRAAARAFLDMLYDRSGRSAVDTARAIAARIEPGRVLDLGGGHGRYAIELVERGFEVTLFDQPVAVSLTRERFGARLAYREGDFATDPIGDGYDVVLASNIVHGMSAASVEALLPKLRDSLRPGGLLVLKDLFVDASGVSPAPALMFGLTMLMFNEGGRSYGMAETRRMLERCGFDHLEETWATDLDFAILFGRRAR